MAEEKVMAEEKPAEKVKLKRIKNLDGVKLVYRWGVGTWFTLLFGLVAIATVVLGALLLPYYTDPATFAFPTAMMGHGTGIDLIKTAFGSFGASLGEVEDTAFGALWALLVFAFMKADEVDPSPITTFFNDSGKFIVLIPLVFFMIAAVFAVILFIMWFIMLVSGRLKHYKGPFTMSIWIFVFNLLYAIFAVVLMIGLLINHNGADCALTLGDTTFTFKVEAMTLFKLFMFPFAMAIISLLMVIVLGIIYKCCFFDHKFIKNAQELEDYKKRMANRKLAKGNVDAIGAPTVVAPGQPVNVVININGYKADATTNDKGEIEVTPEEVKEAPKEAPKEEAKPVEPAPVVLPVAPVPAPVAEEKPADKEELINPSNSLSGEVKFIGGHAFSYNVDLQVADIPDGVPSLGVGAFSNCVNLKAVSIPVSVKEINANCFFNCKRLRRIDYEGTKKEFKQIKRGSNWLSHAGTTIVYCVDGPLAVNPLL